MVPFVILSIFFLLQNALKEAKRRLSRCCNMLGATCAELEGTKLNGLEMDIVINIIVSRLKVSKYDQIWEHFNLLWAIVVLLQVIILVPTYKMQIDTIYMIVGLCGLKRIPGPMAAEQFGEKVTRHQFE